MNPPIDPTKDKYKDSHVVLALSILEDAVRLLHMADTYSSRRTADATRDFSRARRTIAWLRDEHGTLTYWCDIAGVEAGAYRDRCWRVIKDFSPGLLEAEC